MALIQQVAASERDLDMVVHPPAEPGAQFDYSNTNTILLGKVIEKRL